MTHTIIYSTLSLISLFVLFLLLFTPFPHDHRFVHTLYLLPSFFISIKTSLLHFVLRNGPSFVDLFSTNYWQKKSRYTIFIDWDKTHGVSYKTQHESTEDLFIAWFREGRFAFRRIDKILGDLFLHRMRIIACGWGDRGCVGRSLIDRVVNSQCLKKKKENQYVEACVYE